MFEILNREKSKESVPGLVQLLCVVLGFSTLLLFQVLGKVFHGTNIISLAFHIYISALIVFLFIIFNSISAPHHHGHEGHHGHHGKKNDVSHCLEMLNQTSILSNHISNLPPSFKSSV